MSLNVTIECEGMMRSEFVFKLATVFVLVSAGMANAQLAAAADQTLVKIDSGSVRGMAENGVVSFKGIPYAEPPVGQLRWRPPQPTQHWRGVREATKFGPECMQTDNVPKSEDCLTLNVWRPADAKGSLPVMVWIYGGALVHGQTSLYPADNLARQGVIIVSMNYRMGRLGFFAHPALLAERPSELHGNYGYMDQRAALQWVQRNIAAFGGDPRQVTIFGESAGGGSVLTHLTSPLSRGLFARAILQSPGIPTPRAKVVGYTDFATAQKMAADYAASLGIDGAGRKALKALRALSAEELTEGTDAKVEIGALSAGTSLPGVAGSMIDGRLVVEAPDAAIAAGRWAKVPIIVGANNRDLAVGVASNKDELFGVFGLYADEARKIYDPNGTETLDELKQQVFADKTMTEPARHLADLVARSGEPVWLYRFSYVAEALRRNPTWKGALHGFEIPYILDLPAAVVKDKVTSDDKKMGETASAYWVAFGKAGDPNGRGPQWPRHEPGVNKITNFTDTGVVVEPDPLKARLDLWQRVWATNQQDAAAVSAAATSTVSVPVTVGSFIRAETDSYFSGTAKSGAFGKLQNRREMASLDKQDVVRMNRDTLYSSGVFDLDAAPLTIALPDVGKRFMSMQVISEDHYTVDVVYAPGRYTYTRDKVGTRYAYIIVRTLADPQKPEDMKAANAAQDAIKVEQASVGKFEIPNWDLKSQAKVRDALNVLATLRGNDAGAMFGTKAEVDPVAHLIGTAIGWGGNPRSAAIYLGVYPKRSDGKTVYKLTVKDVPVDGFWSISVYNAKGFFEKNELNAYSLNSLTAKPNADGSFVVQFGDCKKETSNCLPITSGWNYTVRLYRPRKAILDGAWKFPEAQTMN